MPRRARNYISGLPYHIVARGNNREACFIEPANYQYYLELWHQLSQRYGAQVHAYCLMTNHIHFLATQDKEGALSNTMKVVGSRYAQYMNLKYHRTGTLWEGRHRSSLIQTERYLLACYRYIELNPVRAGMVTRPEAYRWSSHNVNGWGGNSWLVPHDEYLRLGEDKEQRLSRYRDLFQYQLNAADIRLIRQAAHYGQPVGDGRFRKEIENKYGIQLGQMQRGRPRKDQKIN